MAPRRTAPRPRCATPRAARPTRRLLRRPRSGHAALRPRSCGGPPCTGPRSPSPGACRSRVAPGRWSRPSRRNVDRSLSAQKNGSRSSSKHSTNVWSGTDASRCDDTWGSSWWPSWTPYAAHTPAALRQMVGPPAHDASKLETSMAPSATRSRMPLRVTSLWPAAMGMPGLEPHVAHPAPVVGPAAGLLEPAQVEVRDEPSELDRLGTLVALVGVDHDREVRTGRLARGAHPLGVLAGASGHRP